MHSLRIKGYRLDRKAIDISTYTHTEYCIFNALQSMGEAWLAELPRKRVKALWIPLSSDSMYIATV